MSITYTSNAKLGHSAYADTAWNTVIDANCATLDAFAPVGGLCVTTHEQPTSTTLLVDVAPGAFVDQAGTVQTYAGITSYAITTATTKALYLDGTSSWALAAASSYPTTPHVQLATVVAGATTITSVTDNRHVQRIAGQQSPTLTHLISSAPATVTIAAGAAAGTSPTVAVAGTDLAGTISITTGTALTTGTLGTITFGLTFTATPRCILLTPANAATAGIAADVFANSANITTAHFTIDAASSLSASTAYKWFYAVIG